ncbi:MAG TPA: hypothetical protein VF518_17005, partial [Polyangia bacterium]
MTQPHQKPTDLKSSPRLEDILQKDVQGMRNCPQDLQCADCKENLCVKLVAVADFPTDYGDFRILGFVNNKDGK